VEIGGALFRCVEILKHDSWAATAIYASTAGKALCKFNRRQPILRLPMAWLGRLLADRERHFHARLAGVVGIPAHLGPVRARGIEMPYAFARQFIEGDVLDHRRRVDDDFFPRFARLLAEVHARDVAHVDLHKRENVLVDRAGRPWLIDSDRRSFSGLPQPSLPLALEFAHGDWAQRWGVLTGWGRIGS
jgi:hypothetical protein